MIGQAHLKRLLHGRCEFMNGPLLSVVIPCFNEAPGLAELRRRIITACETAVGDDFEIILVDDGSTDATREILTRFQSEDPRFACVFLSRNYGHQIALTAGLNFVRGQRILVIDADLQDPPELLDKMMAQMDAGFDVVYGRRQTRRGETRFKKVSAKLFYRLLDSIVDIEIARDTGDFRLMSRRVVTALGQMPEQHRFIRGMVSWVGFRQVAIDYDRDERFAGDSKYPLGRMIQFALDAVTGFSIMPLRLATWLGFALAAVSICLMVYVGVSWLSDATVVGWTSLMAAVLLIGSVQLIVIGILGEYVGRLYMQSKARPLFIVDKVLRAEDGAEVMPDAKLRPVDIAQNQPAESLSE